MARDRRRPTIHALGNYAHHLDDQRLLPPRAPGESLPFADNTASASIHLKLPLYTGNRLRNAVDASEALLKSAQHQQLHTRRELIYQVCHACYELLGQRKVIESLLYSKIALQEHHERSKELFNAQKAAKVDLLRTEVRLADIEERLLREQNVLSIQRFALSSLLGIPSKGKGIRIKGKLGLPPLPKELPRAFQRALKDRKDFQAVKARLIARHKQLAIANGESKTEISLQAAYENRWALDTPTGNPSRSEDLGRVSVVFSLPLFDGKRLRARRRQELSRLRAEEEVLRALRLRLQLEVATASSNLESGRARVAVTQKASKQAEESLRIERDKYHLGKGAIVDVLDAQSALLVSQTNYHRALADYNTALAQFRLAIGEER